MTLRQVAYEKMDGMSDETIQLVINYIDLVNTARIGYNFTADSRFNDKYAAFLEGEELRRRHPFPKHIDTDKILEEALVEKYGPFN